MHLCRVHLANICVIPWGNLGMSISLKSERISIGRSEYEAGGFDRALCCLGAVCTSFCE